MRFDAGDTIIRHPARYGQVDFFDTVVKLIRPAKFNHNFQFTAGVSFRLGDFPEEDTTSQTTGDGKERTKRFEVGAQFTSLFVEPEKALRSVSLPRRHAEPGFGARFTFNVTENVAFEAEGNYFTRLLFSFPQGGHMFQGSLAGRPARGLIDGDYSAKRGQDLSGLLECLNLPACRYRDRISSSGNSIRHSIWAAS